MEYATEVLDVTRGPHRMYAELTPGPGVPVVLMHGFPDNTHFDVAAGLHPPRAWVRCVSR